MMSGSVSSLSSSAGADSAAGLRGSLLIFLTILVSPFALWRLLVAHWSSRAALDQARIAQESARNTLFTKAIEQLGATREVNLNVASLNLLESVRGQTEAKTKTEPNTEVRLGAIYALEKLARDDVDLHWPIMETLCAYIRTNAGPPKPPPDNIAKILAKPSGRFGQENEALKRYVDDIPPLRVDVQAALSVIGRRSQQQRTFERDRRESLSADNRNAWRLDLSNCNLARANFDGLNFSEALFWQSSLQLCHFRKTHLEFSTFVEAHMELARLEWARLEGAFLNRTHLEGASLDFAHFDGAELWDIHLEGASLADARLNNVVLENGFLEGARLNRAHLVGASLEGAQLADTVFDSAHLDGTNFDGATISNTSFKNAFLQGASFFATHLDGAGLSGAKLEDTEMSGVDLSGATGLVQNQIDETWGNYATKLPAVLTHPVNSRWTNLETASDILGTHDNRWSVRRDYWLSEARKRAKTELAR